MGMNFNDNHRVFFVQAYVKQVEAMCGGDWEKAPVNPRVDWTKITKDASKKFKASFDERSVSISTGRALVSDSITERALIDEWDGPLLITSGSLREVCGCEPDSTHGIQNRCVRNEP